MIKTNDEIYESNKIEELQIGVTLVSKGNRPYSCTLTDIDYIDGKKVYWFDDEFAVLESDLDEVFHIHFFRSL